MRPDGVSGAGAAQQPTLVERIDAVDISKTNELSETLAGLKNDAEQEIKEAFADGKITKKESQNLSFLMSRFCSLNGQIKTAIRNAGEELKNLYEQLSQSLSATIDRLTKASNGKNPDAQAVVAEEPEETDTKKTKEIDSLTIKEMEWSPEQIREAGKHSAYDKFMAAMNSKNSQTKLRFFKELVAKFGYNSPKTDNDILTRLNEKQTSLVELEIYRLTKAIGEEKEQQETQYEEQSSRRSSNDGIAQNTYSRMTEEERRKEADRQIAEKHKEDTRQKYGI